VEVCFLYDDGPEETEAHHEVSGYWWLDLIAIETEVAEFRSGLSDIALQSISRHRADIRSIHTCNCKYTILAKRSYNSSKIFSIDYNNIIIWISNQSSDNHPGNQSMYQ
jgi:hypothetical protein